MVRGRLSISVALAPNSDRNQIALAVEGAGFDVLSYGQR
jgi:hypothetical protein